ncbi:hypothetical protein AMTR_s00017p00244900 [Amborella trichopoda]|nr:hypothetical protein AMTR_s00017p00244900 [Amborella trichopoda]
MKKDNEQMRIELRHLMGEDLNSLTPHELNRIEDSLQMGLSSVRAKQMEHIRTRTEMLKNNERILEDQNKQLKYIMHQIEGGDEAERRYQNQQNGRDYPQQALTAFRVQPIQPNLQQNK